MSPDVSSQLGLVPESQHGARRKTQMSGLLIRGPRGPMTVGHEHTDRILQPHVHPEGEVRPPHVRSGSD